MGSESLSLVWDAWCSALSRASIQAAFGMAFLLLLERAVPWISAAWRCWLWRLLFLKIALVLCLPVVWHLPLLPAVGTLPRLGQMTSMPRGTEVTLQADLSDAQTESPSLQGGADRAAPGGRTFPTAGWLKFGFGIWLAGVAIQCLVLKTQYRRVQFLIQRSSPCRDELLVQLVRQMAHAVGARIVPRIRIVSELHSPMVVGFQKPCILWPEAFVHRKSSRLMTEDIKIALAHEIAHVVRRDLWWNLLAAVVQTLLFFHPLVWLAGRRYLLAQESACDQMALERARLDRIQFCDLLIRVSQRPRQHAWNPAGVPLTQSHGIQFLRERLNNMQPRRLSRVRRTSAIAASVLGLAMSVCPVSIGFAQGDADGAAPVPGKKVESGSTSVKASKSTSSTSQSGSRSSHASGDRSGGAASSGGSAGGSSGGFSGGSSSGFAGSSSGGFSSGSSSGAAHGSGSSSVTSSGTSGGTSTRTSGGTAGRLGKPAPSSRAMNSSTSNTSTNRSSSNSTNGVQISTNREVTDDGEEIRVVVQEKQRDIQIRQSDADGIEVFVRPTNKNPDKTVTTVTAKTADELKKQNPEAYELYRKYLESRLKQIRSAQAPPNPGNGALNLNEAGANPAQQLMKQHLRELLEDENLPAANRVQIQQMLDELPK
jgi:beta-lactamase regulating signal transducer with metallopeptidase domain